MVKKGYYGNECFGLGGISRFSYAIDFEYFFLEHSFFSYNKLFMINDYSLSKVFYEDLCKAFIFYVEHPRPVFMYKLLMLNIEKNILSKNIIQTPQCLMYV